MIKITHYKPAEKEGARIASFSITMEKWGGFQIREMTLFRKGNQKWIKFPSRMYEVDEEKRYFEYNGFESREMWNSFQDKVIAALEEHARDLPPPSPKAPMAKPFIPDYGQVPF